MTLQELLTMTQNFSKKYFFGDVVIYTEGMADTIKLIERIKLRIDEYLRNSPQSKIYLLNYVNTSSLKKIYSPLDDFLIEIPNSTSIVEKNLEQTKLLINQLHQDALLPYRGINIEIAGVYKHACVLNIYNHLHSIARNSNLQIKHWINNALSI